MLDLSLALYMVSILFLTFYAAHAWLMLYQYIKHRKRPKNSSPELKEYPKVTVQLPVYNEKYVIERLIRSVCELNYPKNKMEIQVLDDSTDETTIIAQSLVKEYRRKGIDIKLIHRPNRKGFKAGALANGLKKAKGEFVAIFDADFVPPSDFLEKCLPYFEDENICAVQTRWGHLNPDYSMLTKIQSILLDGHFLIEQQMRQRSGYFLTFNGTAGVWRKKAIEDAGGWDENVLAEDVDLSFRAQLKGWKIMFLPEVTVLSELPVEPTSFKAQQYRWAKGTIQVGKKLLPQILSSSLLFSQKFEAAVHLTAHLTYPFMLILCIFLLPLLTAKESPKDYRTYFYILSLFSINVIPYLFAYGLTIKKLYKDWKKRIIYIPFVISGVMLLSLNNTLGVLDGFLGKISEFTRTSKYKIEGKQKFRIEIKSPLKLTTVLEFLLGVYMCVTFLYALGTAQFAVLLFIALYFFGFLYISLPSMVEYFKKEEAMETVYVEEEIT